MNNQELMYLLFEMTKTTRCCLQDHFSCGGVTFSQFRIVELVARQGGKVTLSQLHGLLGVEKSTTTRLIEPLINQGLLKREKDAADARIINISLSDKGEAVRKGGWQCVDSFLNQVKDEIGPAKLEDVLDNVGIFLKALHNVFKKGCCL